MTRLRHSHRIRWDVAGAWTMGFGVVAYLALSGGAYDVVVRTEVGIVLWWIVLLGALLGVLPRGPSGRTARLALWLLAAFAAWSAVSATWSESPERAVSETARILMLLGLLLLGIIAIRARHVRALVNGIVVAVALVGVLASLSRLHPAWFGTPETAQFLPDSRSRLSYPLNYWNALAALMAIGLPLTLAVSMTARTIVARTAAVAVVPVLALAGFLTLSRGGVIAAAAGLAVGFALTADPARWSAKLALGSVGAAMLVVGALRRDALVDGLQTPLARDQANELFALAVLVVAGVAVVHVGLSRARAAGRLPAAGPTSRRTARAMYSVAGLAVIAAATISIATGTVRASWEEFRAPPPPAGLQSADERPSRLLNPYGSGRYQFWVAAWEAFETSPVVGIGAGSYETWWARHATIDDTVRNAHSLYLETLAELGVLGCALLLGVFGVVIGVGARRARGSQGAARSAFAGVTGACTAFAVAAAIDWGWQVTVLPACFFLMAAAVLAPRAEDAPSRAQRAGVAGAAVIALASLTVVLAGTLRLRASQEAVATDRLATALRHADGAGRLQPYAVSPLLQRSLVLELQGDLDGAVAAARKAQAKEATNWRPYYVLARLELRRGHPRAALAAYGHARRLNRGSSLLR